MEVILTLIDIMLENFVGNIKKKMEGETCSQCKGLGVECKVATFFNDVNGNPGDVVIYVYGRSSMRTRETISQCPVNTGKNTREEVVDKIKINDAKLRGQIVLSDFKPSNW